MQGGTGACAGLLSFIPFTFHIYTSLLPRLCLPAFYPTSTGFSFHVFSWFSLITPALARWNPKNSFFESFVFSIYSHTYNNFIQLHGFKYY